MAINEIFTDQEDKISEQVKSTLFYSTGDILNEINNHVKPIEKERAAEILEVTFSQIGFEQKQRRDYVLSSMGISTEKAKTIDAELFVRAVGSYGNNSNSLSEFISKSKIDSSIFKTTPVNDEVLKQAQVFSVVASNLENMYSSSLYRSRIKPVSTLLSKLPSDRLASVIDQTRDYIKRVQQLGDEIIQKNPDFSNAMKQLFEITGLSFISNKKQTIGEKLGFCSDLLVSAGILNTSTNQKNPLTEEQIERATGLWLYNIEGAPLAETVLE